MVGLSASPDSYATPLSFHDHRLRFAAGFLLEPRCLQLEHPHFARAGRVNFAAQVHNQEGKLVSDGEWQTRMLRKLERAPSSST